MRHFFVMIGLLFFFANTAEAQESRLSVQPGSKLWIEGTSNVHDWKSSTSTIDVLIEGDIDSPNKVAVSVPVHSLKSGKGGLDNNLYKALKASEFSTIKFVATKYAAGKLSGMLTIAGVTKQVVVDVTGTPTANGVVVKGQTTVLMTDFGVKPPTAMMGAVKSGNAVVVKFDLIVRK